MSKKSSTFVPDLGIVLSATIKSLRVMTRECIFKVEYKGRLWRVIACPINPDGTMFDYRIESNRRLMSKIRGSKADRVIQRTCALAFNCDVDIWWGNVL